MKKLLLTYAKKSMSLVLTVLMLMSCWVFMAPEHAHAAGLQYNVAGVTNYISGKSSTATIKNADDGDNVDYVTLTYPSEIYLDKNETLQDVGYGITFSTHYGDSASDYRIHLMSGSWGGDSTGSQVTQMDKNATMRNAFTSYTFTVTGGTKSTKNGSGSVEISGGEKNGTIKLSGTPNAVGNYTFDNRYETNGTTAADPIMAFFQKINCGAWPADDKLDKGDNNHLGYRSTGSNSGNVLIKVYIYDKAPLNTAISNANTIINNNNAYSAYLVGGNLATLTTEKNNGSTTLSTRAVTQSTVETRTTAINNAANALKFAASNANLLTAIQEANAVKAESDYSIKYTAATRTALETAIANATTNTSYDEGVTTYSVSISNSSTHSAGSKAAADQTAINNLTTALTNAIDAMAIQGYTVKFLNYKNKEVSSKEYPYGTAASAVTVPALSTDPYDATNHFSYSWPTVNNVTGNATYTEIQSGTKHSLNYKDQTNTHHTVYCLYCDYTTEVAHTPYNGKSTPHTCDKDGYITYQCSVCGSSFTKDGYVLHASGNEVADPAAHGSTEVVKYDDNQHGNKCSVCGEFIGELVNHTWNLADADIITAPTCKTPGSGTYRCSCGATKVDTIAIDPNAHKYATAKSNDDGTHTAVCENGCGTDVKDDCVDKDNNCVCDVCGYNIPHVYENKVIAANLVSAADCNSYAVYYKSCKCGDVSEETFEDVDAGYGAHNWDDTEKFLKSKAECGVDAVYYYECLECGKSSEDVDGETWTKTGSALKHNYTANADKSNIVDNDNGTHSYTCQNGCGTVGGTVDCNYGGYTYDSTNHYRTCADCGYVETTAHTMSAWTSDDAAGAVAGTQSRKCTVCDYAENNQTCKYGATVTPATCTTGTITSYTCTDCGHGYSVNDGVVNASNHSDYGTWIDESTAVASTCTENGKDADTKCLGCNAVITEGAERPLDFKNHGDHTTSVDGYVEATCTIEGHTGKVVCDGCGNTITEDTNVGLDENNHVNKTSHAQQNPTCENDGYTAYETCDACDDELGKKVLTKLGHNYTGEAVELDGDVHAYKCERYDECQSTGVGTTKNDTEACSGGSATCIALAVCDICKDTHGDYAAHVFDGAYQQVDGKEEHNRLCSVCENAYGLDGVVDASEACAGGEATCLDKAECELCGGEHGSALGHDYSADADRINQPEDGYHNYKCSRCDEYGIVENDVQVDGGKIACYDAEPVRTAETCTENAYWTHVCDTCAYTWTVTEEDTALGHDYTEKLVNDAHKKADADCENAAVYWYDCSRCEKNANIEEDTDKYTDLTYTNGTALGHEFDGRTEYLFKATEATCTADETYYVYCSVCKVTSEGTDEEATFVKYGTALEHQYAEIVDEEDPAKNRKSVATCTEAAVYYKSCSVCGNRGTETFSYGEALGHTFTEKIMNAAHKITDANCITKATYWYDCADCNTNAANIDKTDMTEEEIAALQYTDGELAPNKHSNLVDVALKLPTCTEDGHSAYKKCEDCGTEIGKVTEGYEKIDHNFTGAYKYDEDADTHQRACANGCGAYSEAVECSFGEWKQSVDADGKATHTRECVCGNTETGDCAGGTATCLEKAECTTCGKTYGETLEHKYPEAWTSTGKNTHVKVCENGCGVDLTEACSGGTATCKDKAVCDTCKTAYGETTDHVFETYVKVSDAKCGVNAKEKATCKYCDATDEREIAGTALKHEMGDYTTEGEHAKAPTCKDEGIEVSYCTREGCDYYVTRTIPAIKDAHIWGEWTVIGGDCATGITEERVCSVCGETENRKNYEVEHEYKEVARVKATCLVDGYIEYVCTNCNFTYVYDNTVEGFPGEYSELKAKGEHTWGEVIETKAPTCAHEGRGYQLCTVCNAKSDNIAIAKLGHGWEDNDGNENDYVYHAPIDATCDTDGHSGYYECTQCANGKTEPEMIFTATGHADKDGDGKCDSCNGEVYDDGDSIGSCNCICHKDNWFMQIIYKIVRFFWKLFGIGKSCDCGFVHY